MPICSRRSISDLLLDMDLREVLPGSLSRRITSIQDAMPLCPQLTLLPGSLSTCCLAAEAGAGSELWFDVEVQGPEEIKT